MQKKTTYWKSKKYWLPKCKIDRGAAFAFSLAKWEVRTYALPASCVTVLDLCCILSLHKKRIAGVQGIQSCKIVFVVCACNFRCILHQTCPMKIQHFTPMRNPVIQSTTLYTSGRPTVGFGGVVGLQLHFRPWLPFFLGRETLSVVGPVVFKNWSGEPVLWKNT